MVNSGDEQAESKERGTRYNYLFLFAKYARSMFKSKMSLSLPTNVEHYRVTSAVIAGNIKKKKKKMPL